MTLCHDKRVNSPKIYNNSKHISTKHQRSKIYEGNINRTEGNKRQLYDKSRKLISSLSTMDKISRQKIKQETEDLNNTRDRLDLIDKYRTLHPTKAEHTFFSSVHGEFSRSNCILDHKTSLN